MTSWNSQLLRYFLTHWCRVTHICVNKLTIIGWYNGLSPGRRQAIIWTTTGICLIGPIGTNFDEILIKIHTFIQNVVWRAAILFHIKWVKPRSVIGKGRRHDCKLVWAQSWWRHQNFLRYWAFLRGIHRSPVNSPHKGQWHGALLFSSICAWIYGWVNNREAGDLRRHRALWHHCNLFKAHFHS